MTRRSPVAVALLAAALAASMTLALTAQGPSGREEALAKARAASARLGRELMAALGAAMKEGGPEKAIAVCSAEAPRLAREVSSREACSVRRVSLRARNPENRPDAWETSVLREFDAEKADGAEPSALERAEVVEAQGRPVLRYLKAISTADLCLTCHGPAVDPRLLETIRKTYPEDRAIGFQKGDLRGAFSVTVPLEPAPSPAPARPGAFRLSLLAPPASSLTKKGPEGPCESDLKGRSATSSRCRSWCRRRGSRRGRWSGSPWGPTP